MAKVKQAKKSKPKEAQSHFDGMEPIRIQAIDDKAIHLLELIDDRKMVTNEIQATQEILIELILKHDVDGYAVDVGDQRYKFSLTKETKLAKARLKMKREGE